MQGRNGGVRILSAAEAVFDMLTILTFALALATEPSVATAPPPTPPAPATQIKAVDENGVPAWAKRPRLRPVQSCETKPNIGVETWRQKYSTSAPQILRPRTPTSTCH